MPEGRFAEIRNPAEDQAYTKFVRRWLFGWIKHLSHRQIRDQISPSGDAKAFVNRRFPIEAEVVQKGSGIAARC